MTPSWNAGTQPRATHRVFDNWDVVPLGWYLLGPAAAIRRGQVRGYNLAGQHVVVFRGQDDRLRALDGFCPHLGTDLAIGRVIGDELRCFFHHWRFDGAGRCTHIPCTDRIPARATLAAYDVRERYGFVWIWPGAQADGPVPAHPELEDRPVYAIAGRRFTRPCHATVSMINGLDAQHLRTVHRLPVDLTLSSQTEATGRIAAFRMAGDLPTTSWRARAIAWFLGGRYAYTMRYVDATVGLLTTLEEVRWFGRIPVEPTRMLFAYTPLAVGVTQVQPIYLTPRPDAWWRRPFAALSLAAMALGFRWLRDEDGTIYDNIRFQSHFLSPLDDGLARFVAWVDRLRPSPWSTTHRHPPSADAP